MEKSCNNCGFYGGNFCVLKDKKSTDFHHCEEWEAIED